MFKLFIIALFVSSTLSAQQGMTDSLEKQDTFLVMHEVIKLDSVYALKNDKPFRYLSNLDSLLKASQKKPVTIPVTTKRSFAEQVLHSSLVKVLLWSLAIFFIFIIIYNLLLRKGVFIRNREYINPEEPIAANELSQDFRKLISQSCRLGDYRLAVRYLFLQTLQLLNERSWIEYAPEKTNSMYAREIGKKKTEFAALVLTYEYTWYGSVQVNKDVFEQIESRFNAFNNNIQ